MKLMTNIKKLLTDFYLSLKRFPWVISFSTATTITLIIIVNYNSVFDVSTVNTLKRIAMCISLGFPLFLIINLLFERFDHYKKLTLKESYLGGILSLFLYYFFLLNELNMVTITRFVAVTLALYLIALLTHYFYKRNNYELYIVHILSRVFIIIIYSAVLFLGLIATLFTLNKLFGLPVTSELYFSIWLMVAGIFAPVFLLAGFPEYAQKYNLKDFPEFIKILLLYIIMPLISLYTFILYLYFIKILVTSQWPQNLVGHLVLWYSVISSAVIFFASPFSEKSKWVKNFIYWFPKIILPLLVMMFVAIGIRINEYGVTENRYFVVALGLWVSGIMIYYNLLKEKRNIILPLSLAIIAFLSVFGPWSAFSVSIRSQNERFEDILSRNNMLQEERIIKKEDSIAEKDKKEINAIINYFRNNHEIKDLKYLPSDFTTGKMEETFGFKYNSKRNVNYNYFTHVLYDNKVPINISDYDFFFEISSKSIPANYQGEKKKNLDNKKNISIKYDNDSFILEIYQKEDRVYSKSLQDEILYIHRKIKNSEDKSINPEEYIFVEENDKIKLKILIKNISGGIDEKDNNNLILHNIKFNIFINIKEE